jgi:hypothetical protein
MKKLSRRQYFRSLLVNAMNAADELRDKPHFFLDELGSLPAAALRAMVPVVFQGTALSVEDGWLVLRQSPDMPPARHMPLSEPQIYAVSRVDGRHSIAEICAETESVFSLSPEAASELVTALFVDLARNGLCHPQGRPE